MIWMDRRAEAQAAALAERISPADFYSPGRREPGLVARGVQGAVGARRGAGCLRRAAHLMPPGWYVLRESAGGLRGRLFERILAGPARSADPRVVRTVLDAVGRRPARCCRSWRPAPRPSAPVTAAFAEASGLDPPRWWWWVRRRDGGHPRGGRLRARRGVRRGRHRRAGLRGVAGPREDPAMLVECHPHADPTSGCSRTPVSSPAATSAGGATSSRSEPTPRPTAGRRLRPPSPRPDVPPGAEGLVFLPACRARWRRSGTAPRGASSTV